jgi:hypothetical protein
MQQRPAAPALERMSGELSSNTTNGSCMGAHPSALASVSQITRLTPSLSFSLSASRDFSDVVVLIARLAGSIILTLLAL